MRTHTPHPSSPKPSLDLGVVRAGGAGGGVKARARLAAQLVEDTRVQQGRGAVLALAKIASRAPPSLLHHHHHHTLAPSRRLH